MAISPRDSGSFRVLFKSFYRQREEEQGNWRNSFREKVGSEHTNETKLPESITGRGEGDNGFGGFWELTVPDPPQNPYDSIRALGRC